MSQLILLDAAPDPAGVGVLLAGVLLVVGFIVLLAVGLVVFLWYRKRSRRGVVMVRPKASPANQVQPSSPNQA